jgi:hypothetical protein
VPIYNIDGNDEWGDVTVNRRSQNGPPRVGLRPNGQGLDLNRDCMKAESPEMQAVLSRIYTTWDPDLMMDLHTTNGTRHGYALTYAPPLTPDTEAGVLAFARDELLPTVRRRMREKHGLETIDYGNASRRGDPAWYTFGVEPRYVTNYVGLRNRIAILSEATSYSTFPDRIEATRRFVEEVLHFVVERADDVVRLTREADAAVSARPLDPEGAPQLGLRFEMASRGREEVLLEKPEARPNPYRPVPVEEIHAVEMDVFDRFEATERATLPQAYVLPADLHGVLALLQRHGVVVEELPHGWSGSVETFQLEQVRRSNRPFQGHRLVELDGRWEVGERRLAPGTVLVRCAQPLGSLIFHLLEPRSLDGAAAWGLFDSALHEGVPYPIRRCLEPVTAPRNRLRSDR